MKMNEIFSLFQEKPMYISFLFHSFGYLDLCFGYILWMFSVNALFFYFHQETKHTKSNVLKIMG